MAYKQAKPLIEQQLAEIRAAGLYKSERVLLSPQGGNITVAQGTVVNLCANNYLGLANHPAIVESAAQAVRTHGYGMASVRFICGTQDLHKGLEQALTAFLGTGDTMLYSSCFDANTGLYETVLGEEDAVLSDALNHASMIDGIRLCKAQRYRYAHGDMADLEKGLRETAGRRLRLIATDGVFSMDGDFARLDAIVELAERYEALVMVDDSHATGFIGKSGRGTPEQSGVADRVDLITSTLGKAIGGGTGGFTSGRRELIELLRQRSRPYLFSNAIPPMICAGGLKALELIQQGDELRVRLQENASFLRQALMKLGFRLKPGSHPIMPVMLGDAALAVRMADRLLEEGVYVIGFSYPVVPKGEARIRVQTSAAHTTEQLALAVIAFEKVGRELGVI
ncbi:MAG TPA: glycine C-acetyltransferase [Nitrospirales bacterium]|jgi:glycine C-acetyltransferase|nr:glycine C-acetyltransferase [Nitrospirales bacterium]